MSKFLATLMALALFSPCIASANIANVDQARNLEVPSFIGYVPDRFIVVLKENVTVDHELDARGPVALSAMTGFSELALKYRIDGLKPQFPGSDRKGAAVLARHYKVSLPAENLDAAMAEYAALPQVERVEKIGIHALYATPNDGYYDPYQWYHNQVSDDDIDSPEAWDIQTGSSNVIVAILDTGTRYYHPDLGGVNASPANVGASRGNMWINTAELNGSSGIDDDGNGYVDDWIGYDFIETTSNCWPGEDCDTKDNDPRDFNGHGTHCAGIVGMISNDGYGMAGVAGGWGDGSQAEYGNGVRVMPLRIGFSYNHLLYGEVGVVYMDAAAEAFYYAADNGAKVASCSWGSSNSGGIGAAANYFIASGGLIFTAAGNDGSQTPSYLGGRSDVIAVAATDQNDAAAYFTTYGTWVDISAPGVGIYSTYHDHYDPNTNYWASFDGTSMACPMAAATAAMIWSQNQTWSAAQVESQLYSSAENIDAELSSIYIGKMGAGRINLYSAVNTGPPPPPVAAFVGSPTSGNEPLTVDFTDQSTGTIDSWSWNFGDGVGTSTAQNPSYTYNTSGTYTVSLTVTNTGGSDTDTKVDYITVNPCVTPVADFVGSPTSGDYPLTVAFTDQSTGAASYSWDFGDGVGTSTEASPSYTYTAAGVYTVTQTVTNACGSDQSARTDYITVTEPSTDGMAYAESDIPVSGTVTGDYTATHSSDNNRQNLQEVETGGKPTTRTTYLEHKWTFTIPPSTSLTFYVEGYRSNNTEGDDFVIAYSTDNTNFTNLLSIDSETEQIYSANIPNTVSGTVYIRAIDIDRTPGNRSLDRLYVDHMYIVHTSGAVPPMANFTGLPTSGVVPLTVSLTDLSTGNPTSWLWDFGDGVGTSTEQNPSYVYNAVGTYTVSLTATNANGSDDEIKVDYITVTDPQQGTDMFVYDVVVSRINQGRGAKKGQAVVTIYDNNSQPVNGATVTGDFTGVLPETGETGITDAAGQATIVTSGTVQGGSGDVCFEVIGVTHASNTYNSTLNNVTQSCEKAGDTYAARSSYLQSTVPETFGLEQNRPNPFNPTTEIGFSLPHESPVTIEVYNIAGQRVALLVNSAFPAGEHTVTWDAKKFTSGVYFYRLKAGEFTEIRKMVLLK